MLDLCTASFVLGGVDLKSCDIKIFFGTNTTQILIGVVTGITGRDSSL